MNFQIITIFPGIFDSYFNESIIKRAQETGAISIHAYNLRDWASDKHRTVDDAPYGGGAGMVMKVDVLYRAIQSISKLPAPPSAPIRRDKDGPATLADLSIVSHSENPCPKIKGQRSKTVLLSAKGKRWNQQLAREYALLDSLILICGRYEGVDERILNYIDEEISIGDYILTGGELGSMVIVDSITRLLPGVLGNEESAVTESHSEPGILEYPQYTRPEAFADDNGIEHRVPDILLSGNHAQIDKWRHENMKYTSEL